MPLPTSGACRGGIIKSWISQRKGDSQQGEGETFTGKLVIFLPLERRESNLQIFLHRIFTHGDALKHGLKGVTLLNLHLEFPEMFLFSAVIFPSHPLLLAFPASLQFYPFQENP